MKILIAEDDVYIREGLTELLEIEGYQCLVACDGEEAMQVYFEKKPDFVLLDIMMPKLNGYEVCKRIRHQDSGIPVIFVSAKSEEIDRVLGLELGADDYIMKPFGNREVIARIRAVTRRCMATQSTGQVDGFEMEDIRVLPSQLRATRGDQVFELSLRDVNILRCLYQQKGNVVSRDELFNQCWGRDYMANSRTLDQHISKLRKLIEKEPKEPRIIRTAHGVGYRF